MKFINFSLVLLGGFCGSMLESHAALTSMVFTGLVETVTMDSGVTAPIVNGKPWIVSLSYELPTAPTYQDGTLTIFNSRQLPQIGGLAEVFIGGALFTSSFNWEISIQNTGEMYFDFLFGNGSALEPVVVSVLFSSSQPFISALESLPGDSDDWGLAAADRFTFNITGQSGQNQSWTARSQNLASYSVIPEPTVAASILAGLVIALRRRKVASTQLP